MCTVTRQRNQNKEMKINYRPTARRKQGKTKQNRRGTKINSSQKKRKRKEKTYKG